MRNQSGFTLIELVVVIVILGILAAVAVPKFVDMQDDAKKSAVNGARGAVASAMSLAHAKWLVNGVSTATSVNMEGVTVTMVNGYPAATAAGIGQAANLGADFHLVASAGGTTTITRVGETAGTGIYSFRYRAATATVPAAVSIVVTGTTGYTY